MDEPKTIRSLFAYVLGLEEKVDDLLRRLEHLEEVAAEELAPVVSIAAPAGIPELCPGCGAVKGKCADTCGYERKHRLDPVA